MALGAISALLCGLFRRFAGLGQSPTDGPAGGSRKGPDRSRLVGDRGKRRTLRAPTRTTVLRCRHFRVLERPVFILRQHDLRGRLWSPEIRRSNRREVRRTEAGSRLRARFGEPRQVLGFAFPRNVVRVRFNLGELGEREASLRLLTEAQARRAHVKRFRWGFLKLIGKDCLEEITGYGAKGGRCLPRGRSTR